MLHKYRLHDPNQAHRTGNYEARAQKIIAKWKEGKWLTQEQKTKITEVLWFYETRLVPYAQMQAATDLMRHGQISAALRLYMGSAKKYFMSFLPFSLSSKKVD